MTERNVMHFTTRDIVALIGREPTEQEYSDIITSLSNNTVLTELFTDTVYTFTIDREEVAW